MTYCWSFNDLRKVRLVHVFHYDILTFVMTACQSLCTDPPLSHHKCHRISFPSTHRHVTCPSVRPSISASRWHCIIVSQHAIEDTAALLSRLYLHDLIRAWNDISRPTVRHFPPKRLIQFVAMSGGRVHLLPSRYFSPAADCARDGTRGTRRFKI